MPTLHPPRHGKGAGGGGGAGAGGGGGRGGQWEMEAGGSKVGCNRRSTNAHLRLTKGCSSSFFKLRFCCAIKFAMCCIYSDIRLGAKSTSQTLK